MSEDESEWTRAGSSGAEGQALWNSGQQRGPQRQGQLRSPQLFPLFSQYYFLPSFLPTFLPCLMSSCSGPGTEDSRGADGPQSLSSRSSHHPHTSSLPAQHPLLPLSPEELLILESTSPPAPQPGPPFLFVCLSHQDGYPKGRGLICLPDPRVLWFWPRVDDQ